MKPVPYVLVFSLLCLLPLGAQAQQKPKKENKPLLRVEQPSTTQVKKQNVEVLKNLSPQLAKAQAAYERKLKTQAYFADKNIKNACEKVPGCAAWAKREFQKDSSFEVSTVQVDYGRMNRSWDGQSIKFDQIRVYFPYEVAGRRLIQRFIFRNVRARDSKCIGCEDYVRKHYMQGGGVMR